MHHNKKTRQRKKLFETFPNKIIALIFCTLSHETYTVSKVVTYQNYLILFTFKLTKFS